MFWIFYSIALFILFFNQSISLFFFFLDFMFFLYLNQHACMFIFFNQCSILFLTCEGWTQDVTHTKIFLVSVFIGTILNENCAYGKKRLRWLRMVSGRELTYIYIYIYSLIILFSSLQFRHESHLNIYIYIYKYLKFIIEIYKFNIIS